MIRLLKLSLKYRLDHQLQCRLHDAIFDHGNPQRTHLAAPFGNLHPPDRLWPVLSPPMRSLDTEASTHDQFRPWISAPCVALAGTADAWLLLCPVVSLTPLPSCLPSLGAALLSTPLRANAVTFGYGVVAYSDTDFHRANVAPSRAHDSRLRGNHGGGKSRPRVDIFRIHRLGAEGSIV